MATTREKSEAYAYANRRMSTSILRGEDEARLDPRRRLNRGLGAGVAIGVVIMAGFGIAGWLGGGSGPDLPDEGAVVVGDSAYVVVEGGVVHPALNLASAMLAGGGEPTEVRQETLDDAPGGFGLPVGIPDAPDALPDADDLLNGDWTLCATPSPSGTGSEPVETAMYVSVPGVPAGESGDAGSGGATLLVETEDGGLWLLTEGRRYAIEADVQEALGLPQDPVRLTSEIINTVPEGPRIDIPDLGPGTGEEPSVQPPFEARVGDLAQTEDNGTGSRHYLVRQDGLVRITELVHTLLASGLDSDNHTIDLPDSSAARSHDDPGNTAWPDEVPEAEELERNQPVCVSTPPGSRPGDTPWQATVHLPQTMPAPEETMPVQAIEGRWMGPLKQIYLPAGSGTLVRSATSGGTRGTYTLVTDSGMAYPFASAEAVQSLGYDPAAAPSMPTAYVELLPPGPVLDPEDAARERDGEFE
jgi:ESX secretion system ATPase EccB